METAIRNGADPVVILGSFACLFYLLLVFGMSVGVANSNALFEDGRKLERQASLRRITKTDEDRAYEWSRVSLVQRGGRYAQDAARPDDCRTPRFTP